MWRAVSFIGKFLWNCLRKGKSPQEALETYELGGGWFKEIRERKSGKAKGQRYPMYTHESGLTCASWKQAEKNGCPRPNPVAPQDSEPTSSEEEEEKAEAA